MRKVRTTMEPHREYEVTEQEYTDLERQGLIHKPTGKADTKGDDK